MVYNLTIISLFYPYKQKTYTNDIYNIVYIYIPYAPWYIYLHHWVTGWWSTYPSEKYESMGRIIPYMKWTKKMFETTNQINSLTWTKVIFRMLPFKSSFSHDFYGGFTPVLPIFFWSQGVSTPRSGAGPAGHLNSPGISLTGSVVQDAETIEVLSWRFSKNMGCFWSGSRVTRYT